VKALLLLIVLSVAVVPAILAGGESDSNRPKPVIRTTVVTV
jgi:hypothetical protein